MDSRKQLNKLLKKYQRKQCTPEEKQRLEQWLDELHILTQADHVFTSNAEAEELGRTIWAGIEKKQGSTSMALPIIRLMRPWAAAATVVGVLWLGWLWHQHTAKSPVFTDSLVSEWDTVSTPQQSLKKVVLADGSRISLNCNSQLRYPKSFAKPNREIELLQGEANFDIAHDARHPFIVHSNGVTTRVLGTQFTVTAYRKLNEIRVSVTRGKVQVKVKERPLGLLTKNQEIRYNMANKSVKTYSGNVCVFDIEKQSYFLSNCSFEELAIRMENAFGLKLIAGNQAVSTYRFTGELDLKSSPHNILTKFSGIHAGQFKITGKEAFMY